MYALRAALLLLCVVSLSSACTKKSGQAPQAGGPATPAAKLTELQKSVEQAPSYENFIALGLEFAAQNRFGEATDAYQKAADINPQAPIAWNNLCAAFNTQGRYADAVETCEKAVAAEPNFALAKNNLADATAKLSHMKTTVMAKKAELMKPTKNSTETLDNGMQFFLVRDLETANAIWRRIQPSDPLYPSALNNLASSYILSGKYADAEKALGEAMKLQPDNVLFANNKKWLDKKKSGK